MRPWRRPRQSHDASTAMKRRAVAGFPVHVDALRISSLRLAAHRRVFSLSGWIGCRLAIEKRPFSGCDAMAPVGISIALLLGSEQDADSAHQLSGFLASLLIAAGFSSVLRREPRIFGTVAPPPLRAGGDGEARLPRRWGPKAAHQAG